MTQACKGNIMMDIQEAEWEGGTGFIWFRIGTSGRHL
jgi:hypothetical protein